MALNRRPSLLAGYHNPYASPERFIFFFYKKRDSIVFIFRTALPPYLFQLPPSVSMSSHIDEHSKRARYPPNIPLSIDVKKVFNRTKKQHSNWSRCVFQEQTLYQPQTEAISPIHDEPKLDSNMRDMTILRNSISKLESDIEITMKKLHRAKRNQVTWLSKTRKWNIWFSIEWNSKSSRSISCWWRWKRRSWCSFEAQWLSNVNRKDTSW